MYDQNKFEVLDYQIAENRFTPGEAANHLNVPEEVIEMAIEEGEFDDIIEYQGEKLIHLDDIKDFILYGGVKKIQQKMEDNYNE